MSSSVLSGELESELGPSASQPSEHKGSVLPALLQFSHCKRLFHFHANTVCSRLFLCFAPSHLQCRRDNLALLPVLFDASQECKAYASVALCNCLLFSRIMTGNYLPAANNCHVPVRGGRELAALRGAGNLLTGGDLARIKTTI